MCFFTSYRMHRVMFTRKAMNTKKPAIRIPNQNMMKDMDSDMGMGMSMHMITVAI